MKKIEIAFILLAVYVFFIPLVLYLYSLYTDLLNQYTLRNLITPNNEFAFIFYTGAIFIVIQVAIYLGVEDKDQLEDIENQKEKGKNDLLFSFSIFLLVAVMAIYIFILHKMHSKKVDIILTQYSSSDDEQRIKKLNDEMRAAMEAIRKQQ